MSESKLFNKRQLMAEARIRGLYFREKMLLNDTIGQYLKKLAEMQKEGKL